MTNTQRTGAFKRDCRVVNMKLEYPGYIEDIQWLIVSDLTEKQIMEMYPEEVKYYTPFIYMTREMFAPIVESDNNNRKYRRRAALHEDLFGYEDGIFERFHSELFSDPFDQPDWSDLHAAISKLSTSQQVRVHLWAFEGMSFVEIAKQEGVAKQTDQESVASALKKMKKYLTET